MSIHTDKRQFGSDEERAEWKQEMNREYRRQEYLDDLAEGTTILEDGYDDYPLGRNDWQE